MLDIEQIKNKILCDDCMNILKQLPDKCIDLVLTDPPYGINVGKKTCIYDGKKHGNAKTNRKIYLEKIGIIKFLKKKYLMRYLE